MIVVDRIGKAFGAHVVLDDFSLEVAKGEVVCIIGPSGSGKSTALRCINGLETYDRGTITIDGVRVDRNEPSIHALRAAVATTGCDQSARISSRKRASDRFMSVSSIRSRKAPPVCRA